MSPRSPPAFRLVIGKFPLLPIHDGSETETERLSVKKVKKIYFPGIGLKSARGSPKSWVGDGWKRGSLQRGATEPVFSPSTGRPAWGLPRRLDPGQKHRRRERGNPRVLQVAEPRKNAAQGRCGPVLGPIGPDSRQTLFRTLSASNLRLPLTGVKRAQIDSEKTSRRRRYGGVCRDDGKGGVEGRSIRGWGKEKRMT